MVAIVNTNIWASDESPEEVEHPVHDHKIGQWQTCV